MEKKSLFARWRANFVTGLLIVLPAIVSAIILVWAFGTISYVTDSLLFFIPQNLTHKNHGEGGMYWYWSVAALIFAIVLISVIGRLARNYFGKKMIEWMEIAMLRIPLFNKIYGAIKQVNEAFTTGGANSFKTVVLVEYPREGVYSLGFLTSEQHSEVHACTGEDLIAVFIPTTPNPTSGFLILLPENKVTKLQMSVADGVKYIVSLGAIAPVYFPLDKGKIAHD